MSFKKKNGKVKILPHKTFKELSIDTDKLNLESHKKIFVECCTCGEVFLREFRKLCQLHCCPIHIIKKHELKLKKKIDHKTFDDWLTNYLTSKKNYCKKEDIKCDLTKKFLKAMWESQNKRCYYSKIKLEFGIKTMHSATLDRIDPTKGYLQNNVVWCSNAINNMKNDYSKEELNLFLQNIIFTNVRIELKKDHPDAKPPFRKRTTDAGYDLSSISDVIISPGKVVNINTGLRISAPEGWYFTIDGRSSLFKEGIVPFRGIIDSNYTGPLLVSLYNSSNESFKVNKGDRIAQIIPHKIHNVDFVEVKDFSPEYYIHRGEAGWGSSGRK